MKTQIKKLKDAYDEARHCGYMGSFIDYLKSVGVDLNTLNVNHSYNTLEGTKTK